VGAVAARGRDLRASVAVKTGRGITRTPRGQRTLPHIRAALALEIRRTHDTLAVVLHRPRLALPTLDHAVHVALITRAVELAGAALQTPGVHAARRAHPGSAVRVHVDGARRVVCFPQTVLSSRTKDALAVVERQPRLALHTLPAAPSVSIHAHTIRSAGVRPRIRAARETAAGGGRGVGVAGTDQGPIRNLWELRGTAFHQLWCWLDSQCTLLQDTRTPTPPRCCCSFGRTPRTVRPAKTSPPCTPQLNHLRRTRIPANTARTPGPRPGSTA
jgi:hypothetical protein